MRVLVAGTYGERNGIETYTRHLVTALTGAGHEVILADRSSHSGTFGDPGRARLRPRSWPIWRLAGPFEAARVARGLRDAIRDLSPDVVHVTYPEFAPRITAPVIVTAWHPETGVLRRATTSRIRGERARLGAMYAMSDRIALRRAQGVVATSRAVERTFGGRTNVQWIPPFLSDEVVQAASQRRSRDCLMVAGKLDDPRKGLPLAIAAVEMLRLQDASLRLVLIGGWSAGAPPTGLPDFCDIREPMEPDELASSMRAAGCLLLPSLWEEFGYVALEALAAGTPVACTPLPGFEGLESNGLVMADSREPSSLAEAAWRALAVGQSSFPDACRASVAIVQLERLYHAVSR